MAKQLQIDLDCGLVVQLSSMLILETYGTLLEGMPNDRINEKLLRSHLESIRRMWGDKPIYIMEPTQFTNDRHQREFYPYLAAAHLWSRTPITNPTMHGSHLLLIQFHKELSEILISEFVARAKTVSWSQYAHDFQW